ncbi:DUF1080 domain-containing protein [candidate division KSB1 bacterium]|nr:DUF1080 domain-containing protein [candidate division KSB1 bacterium]
MKKVIAVMVILLFALICVIGCGKTEQKLDTESQAIGTEVEWITLFDGAGFDAWEMTRPGGWIIQDSAMYLAGKGYIWTKETFGDFVLDLDFKVSPKCNSGIFFRTANTKDEVQTGFEMQVFDSFGKDQPDKHDCGAVYDALAPSVNAVKPAGEWNHVTITCDSSFINIVLNDSLIIDMDLDMWTIANQNPDGTKNKFNTALKDFAHEGYIGFQDHGSPVWYRNVRIIRL